MRVSIHVDFVNFASLRLFLDFIDLITDLKDLEKKAKNLDSIFRGIGV